MTSTRCTERSERANSRRSAIPTSVPLSRPSGSVCVLSLADLGASSTAPSRRPGGRPDVPLDEGGDAVTLGPNSRLRIIVLGYLIRGPVGGLAWHHLQYVMGLVDLGHDAYFLEDSDDYPSCYEP